MNRGFKRATALALTMGLIAVSAIAPSASAAPPDWSMPVTPLSPMVKSGSNAGYQLQIRNDGTSNISQLYLTWSSADAPTYIGVPTYTNTDNAGDVCERDNVGPLSCYFGPLRAGGTIDLVVGYRVPVGTTTATFNLLFQANTNGSSFSDAKKRSRGDTLDGVYTTPQLINNSDNFGGDWTLSAGTVVANATGLSRRNPQSVSVSAPGALLNTTVEDGLADTAYTCPTDVAGCAARFGEWAQVNVGDGATFGNLFRITIMVLGGAVPGGVNANDIVVVHVPDSGPAYTISQRCTLGSDGKPSGTTECLVVNRVGPNFQIDVWVIRNGAFRPGAS